MAADAVVYIAGFTGQGAAVLNQAVVATGGRKSVQTVKALRQDHGLPNSS